MCHAIYEMPKLKETAVVSLRGMASEMAKYLYSRHIFFQIEYDVG